MVTDRVLRKHGIKKKDVVSCNKVLCRCMQCSAKRVRDFVHVKNMGFNGKVLDAGACGCGCELYDYEHLEGYKSCSSKCPDCHKHNFKYYPKLDMFICDCGSMKKG
jgi:hypothetical protein